VPGATSLEDMLPLMFLSGSLAAPPATAGATTGAVPAPTAVPAEPVRRSVAESSQHPRRSAGDEVVRSALPCAGDRTRVGDEVVRSALPYAGDRTRNARARQRHSRVAA
jgi:hypothetical protein